MLNRLDQSGVALIQILLISAVISLLALSFTHTARDQLVMAEQFDNRIKAKLAAQSAFNQAVFVQLSDVITSQSDSFADLNSIKADINLFGEPIRWNEKITVTIQDLNGLLPQHYPRHALWGRVLRRSGFDAEQVRALQGLWKDAQDPDVNAWMGGEREPDMLPSGQRYLDGYAQTDHVMRWIFEEHPTVLHRFLSVSDKDAPFDTNIFNAPSDLIEMLFTPSVANEIIQSRVEGGGSRAAMRELLPAELQVENIYQHNSSVRVIHISYRNGSAVWSDKWKIQLKALNLPPFKVIER